LLRWSHRKPQIRGRPQLTAAPMGVVVVGGIEGAFWVGCWWRTCRHPVGHHLWRHTSARGMGRPLWWLGGGLLMLLAWGQSWSNVASTIYSDESLAAWCSGGSTMNAGWWTRAGWRLLVSWWCRWQAK
jgi:hypothetical protein